MERQDTKILPEELSGLLAGSQSGFDNILLQTPNLSSFNSQSFFAELDDENMDGETPDNKSFHQQQAPLSQEEMALYASNLLKRGRNGNPQYNTMAGVKHEANPPAGISNATMNQQQLQLSGMQQQPQQQYGQISTTPPVEMQAFPYSVVQGISYGAVSQHQLHQQQQQQEVQLQHINHHLNQTSNTNADVNTVSKLTHTPSMSYPGNHSNRTMMGYANYNNNSTPSSSISYNYPSFSSQSCVNVGGVGYPENKLVPQNSGYQMPMGVDASHASQSSSAVGTAEVQSNHQGGAVLGVRRQVQVVQHQLPPLHNSMITDITTSSSGGGAGCNITGNQQQLMLQQSQVHQLDVNSSSHNVMQSNSTNESATSSSYDPAPVLPSLTDSCFSMTNYSPTCLDPSDVADFLYTNNIPHLDGESELTQEQKYAPPTSAASQLSPVAAFPEKREEVQATPGSGLPRGPSIDLTTLESSPGMNEFTIEILQNEKKKNKYCYSSLLHRAYLVPDKSMEVRLRVTDWDITETSSVSARLCLVYQDAHWRTQPVNRCFNCKNRSKGKMAPHMLEHLLQVGNSGAQYGFSGTRHTVTVPLSKPVLNLEYATLLVTLCCMTSCVGGPNRRPFSIVFSLMVDGEERGRQLLPVKCCMGAPRDMKKNETDHINAEKPANATANAAAMGPPQHLGGVAATAQAQAPKRPSSGGSRAAGPSPTSGSKRKSGTKKMQIQVSGNTVVVSSDSEPERGSSKKTRLNGSNSETAGGGATDYRYNGVDGNGEPLPDHTAMMVPNRHVEQMRQHLRRLLLDEYAKKNPDIYKLL